MQFLLDLIHSLGLAGVFALCLFDGSILWMAPGINDIVLISFVVANGRSWAWALAAVVAATGGSVLGALFSYRLGHSGGGALLRRRFPSGLMQRVESWTDRYGALPVGIAAVMPPPCPYAPFVFSAGIMNVRRDRFCLSVLLGRGMRYALDAWLAVLFGHKVLPHLHALYWVALRNGLYVALTVLAIYGAFRVQFARREYGMAQYVEADKPEV